MAQQVRDLHRAFKRHWKCWRREKTLGISSLSFFLSVGAVSFDDVGDHDHPSLSIFFVSDEFHFWYTCQSTLLCWSRRLCVFFLRPLSVLPSIFSHQKVLPNLPSHNMADKLWLLLMVESGLFFVFTLTKLLHLVHGFARLYPTFVIRIKNHISAAWIILSINDSDAWVKIEIT